MKSGAFGWLLLVAASVSGSSLASAQSVSTTSATEWVADYWVRDIAVRESTVYLGGGFRRIGPKLGPLTALDSASGLPIAGLPRVGGTAPEIDDIEPDGFGGYVIAGRFTSVGGVERSGLARIDSNGAVDVGFAPSGMVSAAEPLATRCALQRGRERLREQAEPSAEQQKSYVSTLDSDRASGVYRQIGTVIPI